jgi:hypothetical protein
VRQYWVISAKWTYTELRKEVGGHSVISFRQKLERKSSHLSRQFL